MRPLSELQERVLVALLRLEQKPRRFAWTPNEIGYEAGARTVRGGGSGSVGAARAAAGRLVDAGLLERRRLPRLVFYRLTRLGRDWEALGG